MQNTMQNFAQTREENANLRTMHAGTGAHLDLLLKQVQADISFYAESQETYIVELLEQYEIRIKSIIISHSQFSIV